ncbi:hypothetical protein F5887DRAFT_990753 [Amanita rubescens]|nr:hypothetical protein F5887DRAFT_991298 [Amanita rubescens]KAF8334484.1 hypothetical protein F5887DRAFT_990753 [Amanita rubescens]
MLFWHFTLLFSVLSTSVLATSQADGNSQSGDPRVAYGKLKGCWQKFNDANQFIGIVGGKIAYSSQDIDTKPEALDNTYWKQSNRCPEGCVFCGSLRTEIVDDRIRIIKWNSEGSDSKSYSVKFHPANKNEWGGQNWRVAKNLKIGGMFKIRQKARHQ